MFRTVSLSIIRGLALYSQQQVYVIQVMMNVLASGIRILHPDPAPDDGQRNYPKNAEFYSKNKFEKSVHLVGFVIRIYHDARSSECQIILRMFMSFSRVSLYVDCTK